MILLFIPIILHVFLGTFVYFKNSKALPNKIFGLWMFVAVITSFSIFYQGIAKYELKKWDEAIAVFDKALKIYPQFSDAKYYKAICWLKQAKPREEAIVLISIAKEDAAKGYTINEDNTIYETYPYQNKFSK